MTVSDTQSPRAARRGASFEDWISVGRALVIGRAVAMRQAKANKPMGSRYSAAFGSWLDTNELRGMSNQERYRAILIVENLTEIDKWRTSLGEARRHRLNHPGAVWWAWKRGTKPAAGSLRHATERRPIGPKANGRAQTRRRRHARKPGQ